MNEIVWPCDRAEPSHQVVVGYTEKAEPPKWLKYSCSVRPMQDSPRPIEVTGKRAPRRKRVTAAAVPA